MPYDLALSSLGDLIVTAHRDLAGISGSALTDQRIVTRLRLHRGAWKYDFDQNLGSQLYTLSGTPADRAAEYVDAYVREALADMQEITVVQVQTYPTDHDLTMVIVYEPEITGDDTLTPTDSELEQVAITLPIAFASE